MKEIIMCFKFRFIVVKSGMNTVLSASSVFPLPYNEEFKWTRIYFLFDDHSSYSNLNFLSLDITVTNILMSSEVTVFKIGCFYLKHLFKMFWRLHFWNCTFLYIHFTGLQLIISTNCFIYIDFKFSLKAGSLLNYILWKIKYRNFILPLSNSLLFQYIWSSGNCLVTPTEFEISPNFDRRK